MQNKQLERELKVIVQNLKPNEIHRILEIFSAHEGMQLDQAYSKSGLNCTCCTLRNEATVSTGFGRSEKEALVNATKNYLETLIAANSHISQLKTALRQREGPSQSAEREKGEDTLELEERDLNDVSAIGEERGCECVYFEIHRHHQEEIRNMEARMRLLAKENQMLRSLLMREGVDLGRHPNKENLKWGTNH